MNVKSKMSIGLLYDGFDLYLMGTTNRKVKAENYITTNGTIATASIFLLRFVGECILN